jgi:hypothetical protein
MCPRTAIGLLLSGAGHRFRTLIPPYWWPLPDGMEIERRNVDMSRMPTAAIFGSIDGRAITLS